jgi:hypothetical protein
MGVLAKEIGLRARQCERRETRYKSPTAPFDASRSSVKQLTTALTFASAPTGAQVQPSSDSKPVVPVARRGVDRRLLQSPHAQACSIHTERPEQEGAAGIR